MLSYKEHVMDEMFSEFKNGVLSTLRFQHYTMTKMKEKSLIWNKLGIQILERVNDEDLKNELAYKFANFMIKESLKFSNEQPIIVKEIEERFIRKAISN